jgi:hypothetical protein
MKNLVDFLILCIETVYFALKKPYMVIFNFLKKHITRFEIFIKRKTRVFLRNYLLFFFRKFISHPLSKLLNFLIQKHSEFKNDIAVFFNQKLLFIKKKLNDIVSFYKKKLKSSFYYKIFMQKKFQFKIFIENSNKIKILNKYL